MDYDVIIVGAGSMGMAAGYYLARDGKRVLLLDAHDPPHTEGSHHGETRIIRHAYGEGESYVSMALRAQVLWNELQNLSGEELFINTGVLTVARPESKFMQNVLRSAEAYGLNVEQLAAEEINFRWNGFKVPEGYIGCHELESGVLMSENCIRAFKVQALKHGAILKVHTPATAISVFDKHVEVAAGSESFTADSLIVAPGAAARKLLSMIGLSLPLEELRTSFSWFKTDERIYSAEGFPAYLFELPAEMYYGFPSINGTGVKIGRHDGGRLRDMQKPPEAFGTYEQDQQDVAGFAERCLPKVGKHHSGKTCSYTNTPDGDFIIDQHPDYPHIVLACGFSGHGFKFSSVVGEILSELVTGDRKSVLDIRPFSIHRFEK